MPKTRLKLKKGIEQTAQNMADLANNETLRKQSKKGYESRTNLIMKRLGFKDAADMFEHPDKIIESIDSTYENWNSRKTMYTALISFIKHTQVKVPDETQQKLYDKMMEGAAESRKIASQNLPPKQLEGSAITWKDIVQLEEKLRNEQYASPHHLLVAMYTLIDARRLGDYNMLQICTTAKQFASATAPNKILVNRRNKFCQMQVADFKTMGSHGTYERKITGVLYKIIAQSVRDNPRTYLFENTKNEPYTEGTFSKFFTDTFKTELNHSIGLQTLRHLYVTYIMAKNLSHAEKEKIAYNMGSSVAQQSSTYNIASTSTDHATKDAKVKAGMASIREASKKVLEAVKGNPDLVAEMKELFDSIYSTVSSFAA
jgi:hypothetical protein